MNLMNLKNEHLRFIWRGHSKLSSLVYYTTSLIIALQLRLYYRHRQWHPPVTQGPPPIEARVAVQREFPNVLMFSQKEPTSFHKL